MPENESLIFYTDRLLLREFKEDDWPAVHQYGSDPEVVNYLPFGPNTEQETRTFLNSVLAEQKEQPRFSYNFALINRSDGKLIGSCRIKITTIEYKNEGEIGYILNRNYWNQGYTTEAAQKVVSFGFEQRKLHRIFATCDPANTASYRVMEKIGMQREGCLREYKIIKGIWRDCLLYSVLAGEWQDLVKRPFVKPTPDLME
jgi:[ribosomal protein S5]-alanine N-acetyltransferase